MRTLLLFSILATTSIAPALADCSRRTNVSSEFHQSDLVFVGKVISASYLSPKPSDGSSLGISYKLSVVEQFRGKPKNTVLIFSENDSGRYEMPVGETFILFARFNPKTLVGPAYWVYNCGFSGVASASPKTLTMLRNISQVPSRTHASLSRKAPNITFKKDMLSDWPYMTINKNDVAMHIIFLAHGISWRLSLLQKMGSVQAFIHPT